MLWQKIGFGLLFQRAVHLRRAHRGLPVHQQSHFLSCATPRKMEPHEEDPFLAGWASWMDQALQAEPADVELSPELQAQEARLEAVRSAPKPAIIIAARGGDVDALRQELDLGVSVDLADAWKSKPLQVACGAKDVSGEDRFACAELLVSRGACLEGGRRRKSVERTTVRGTGDPDRVGNRLWRPPSLEHSVSRRRYDPNRRRLCSRCP